MNHHSRENRHTSPIGMYFKLCLYLHWCVHVQWFQGFQPWGIIHLTMAQIILELWQRADQISINSKSRNKHVTQREALLCFPKCSLLTSFVFHCILRFALVATLLRESPWYRGQLQRVLLNHPDAWQRVALLVRTSKRTFILHCHKYLPVVLNAPKHCRWQWVSK